MDEIRTTRTDRITLERFSLRCRYALRFTELKDDGDALARVDTVRKAFNSPFRPSVLATTSVGQEGLDFHLYCHAVVHWNLPSNPVDLEQREGRVHRYKGHAIRKNLARIYGDAALADDEGDPWERVFSAAVASRTIGESDLVPYWVHPGEAAIERYVPALPLSKEVSRLTELKRSLALYRLVFGQPRQEDLIEYLASRGLAVRSYVASWPTCASICARAIRNVIGDLLGRRSV